MSTAPQLPEENQQVHSSDKAWIVSVNMGYGHDRAAYPLSDIANGGIISANDYIDMPIGDRKIWDSTRSFYERFSRLKNLPVVGDSLFEVLDRWQEIQPFYPIRDLSRPSIQVRAIYRLFKQKNFLRHLIETKLAKNNLPLISTFFIPALAADYYGYKNDIYCVITDTDMSRAWVPLQPRKTKIKYFAPSRRVVERLKLYGVPQSNILLTGFPLPKENIGGVEKTNIKRDLGRRLAQLDRGGNYMRRFSESVTEILGQDNIRSAVSHPLTVMFAVGGAGAQRNMVGDILRSFQSKLKREDVRLFLVAGSRDDVRDHFEREIEKCGLSGMLGRSVRLIYNENRFKYFSEFNDALRSTDVLWTKPSELSFYAGLGIPIIMADPIGSQEEFNFDWLRNVGAGIPQEDPRYASEWLDDWIHSGWLARAAVGGFVNAPKRGTYRIEEIIAHKKQVLPEPIEPV
ncbi:MAG: hypothetical protein ACD_76C00105G0004 [uncultured bacterium]|nr:MAG: hypothetical protein ACD_76C00105G0004 [uncultured bacterium]HBD04992.1 hypothetical protein [Candidatus Uhrbacteria bacterium]